MSLGLMLLLVACGPKNAAVAAPSAPVAIEARDIEARALEELAVAIEQRDDAAELQVRGAELARALAVGSADAHTREAAVELLLLLRDAPLNEEVPAESGKDTGLGAVAEDPLLDPEIVDTGFDTGASSNDPDLDPSGQAADARVAELIAEDQRELARAALRAGDWLGAVDALEPLKNTPSWASVEPYYIEAVDGWVGAERERIGQDYVATRGLPRAERLNALRGVRDDLDALVRTWPDSAYEEPLRNNLARVERELAELDGL